MKLLIVAGPYEADLIRRAAVAAGAEAVAVEASDSLPAWIAASRPDLIVLAAGVLHADGAAALARVRDVPGGDVPVLFLCDADEVTTLAAIGDGAFARPVAPDAVVRRAAELVGAPLPSGAEFAASSSSARRRGGSGSDPARGSGATPLAPTAPADLPVLRPLERAAAAFAGGAETVVKTPWLRRIAASIDDALDAEMERTLASLAPGKIASAEATRQVPPELIANILAVSARASAGTVATEPAVAEATASRVRGAADAWLEGELATTDMPSLLGRALLESLTGRLRVRRDGVEKSVFFEAGRPVLAVSNVAQDRMVQMLVRQARLTAEQASRAMALATETGRRMGAVLIDLGYMKSSELLPAVRQHYEELITSLFAWDSGTYRIEVGAVADPRRVRLLRHPAALVVEGLRRCYALERLRSTLAADPGGLVLRLEPRASASDALLELAAGDPAAQRLPVLFDGVRTFREVVRVSGLPEPSVLQLAIALRALGLLAAVQQGAAPRSEPVAARDREIDRERIAARHALVREGDYFQLLGLDRGASEQELRAAYGFLSREFADETIGPELARDQRVELEEIRLVLDEAMHVLGDPTLRSEYAAHLPPASDRPRDAAPLAWGSSAGSDAAGEPLVAAEQRLG
jgi:hypothetical protein